jgi:hypothetical protein
MYKNTETKGNIFSWKVMVPKLCLTFSSNSITFLGGTSENLFLFAS